MIDKTDTDGRNVSADQLRDLPDEKLEELASCANGTFQYCPNCGELTAFPTTPTYNDSSECHACEYRQG